MNDLNQALRAALRRSLDQRSADETNAQRSARVLRIGLEAAEPPAWSGDVVALMQPAPADSADARWATALGLDGASVGFEPIGRRPGPRLLVVLPATGAFSYPQVREYTSSLLVAVATSHPAPRRVGLALPGVANGLDEGACLEHLLLGVVDELAAQPVPPALSELVLLEPNDTRRQFLAQKLAQLLGADLPPPGWTASANSWPLVYLGSSANAQRPPSPFEQRLTYKDSLTAFVAMPFNAEMRDIFLYGIQGPASRSKFKAERLDFEHFTGSVIEQIKDRIQRAHLVIADLTGANANVFLEIGYAWGKGRPTVLLLRKPADCTEARAPFDVASDSRIEYTDIAHLDRQLTERLQALYPSLRQRAMGPG